MTSFTNRGSYYVIKSIIYMGSLTIKKYIVCVSLTFTF